MCHLVHDELSLKTSLPNFTSTSKSFGVTMFVKQDGSVGIETEPSNGLNL
jgi:hypothetical protein